MNKDFLEQLEEQLVAATERAGARRRLLPGLLRRALPVRLARGLARASVRAPTAGVAAAVVAVLAASAFAATLTLPLRRAPAPVLTAARAAALAARAGSYTTAGAVPAGFQPRSFTAISETDWWLLGSAPCGRRMCTAIVHTTDGGPVFTRVGAPPTRGVSQVRFANARDGYAYGPQLWTTTDGGRRWSEDELFGAVELAAADGYVYAITYNGGPAELMRAVVGSQRWQPVGGFGRAYRLGQTPPTALWVQGATVLVGIGNRLFVSPAPLAPFRPVAGIPKGLGDCAYDAVSGPAAIWALCSAGMAPDLILRSTDGGQRFTTAAQVPNGPIDAFAAASATVAVASGQGPLYVTTNGGSSWTPAQAPSAGWAYLGFTDATHGVALGLFGSGRKQVWRLYYTTDAGASYHYVPIGP
ncbi:MAG: hypothetical protein M0T77_13575 [Actinomycetota bacterium]|nr:hypothetical protein [Actinomycetota bacterium]